MAKASKIIPVAIATNSELLDNIVKATKAGGFMYVSVEEVSALVESGFVETNSAYIEEGTGKIAARATEKGTNSMSNEVANEVVVAVPAAQPEAAKPTVMSKSAVAIDDYIPVMSIKRVSRSGEAWPFDGLAVNQSFHVATTEARPDPAKSIASSVSVANARYAVATGEKETVTLVDYEVDATGKRVKVAGHFVKKGDKQVTRDVMKREREFVIRTVGAEDPRGAGVRVVRVK